MLATVSAERNLGDSQSQIQNTELTDKAFIARGAGHSYDSHGAQFYSQGGRTDKAFIARGASCVSKTYLRHAVNANVRLCSTHTCQASSMSVCRHPHSDRADQTSSPALLLCPCVCALHVWMKACLKLCESMTLAND